MTVADFIAARLGEDEEYAGTLHSSIDCASYGPISFSCDCEVPARVLRQVAAMRAILALYTDGDGCVAHGPDYGDAMGQVVEAMASVWSDHPDYQPGRPWEWSPDPVREMRRDLGAEHLRQNHQVYGGQP